MVSLCVERAGISRWCEGLRTLTSRSGVVREVCAGNGPARAVDLARDREGPGRPAGARELGTGARLTFRLTDAARQGAPERPQPHRPTRRRGRFPEAELWLGPTRCNLNSRQQPGQRPSAPLSLSAAAGEASCAVVWPGRPEGRVQGTRGEAVDRSRPQVSSESSLSSARRLAPAPQARLASEPSAQSSNRSGLVAHNLSATSTCLSSVVSAA